MFVDDCELFEQNTLQTFKIKCLMCNHEDKLFKCSQCDQINRSYLTRLDTCRNLFLHKLQFDVKDNRYID